MKTRLLVVLCGILFSGSLVLSRATEAAADEAARLLAEFEATWKAQAPKEIEPRDRRQWHETKALQARELALEFLARYPDDPRRWIVVDQLFPTVPRFVKQWAPMDEEGHYDKKKDIRDEAAVAAWTARVAVLRAEMAVATDIPEELKRKWAANAKYESDQLASVRAFFASARSGKVAPDFVMQDIDGRDVKLSDFRGKVVVLDFWAPWCGPCKESMPHTQEVAAKYRDQGVVVIGSCTRDTRANFEKWVQANRAKYPDFIWAHDPAELSDERPAKKLYGVTGIPAQFIIDREGRMVDGVLGYAKGEAMLDAALARAGVKVDPAVVAQGAEDLRKRGYGELPGS